ncbi:hypothetical protein FBEOM_10105 [Fusarium beomiforme]|uniref:Uncharacterized protein n=1 Tax=Fusarium beomiforme TaxID=44412 RepID=A0A9P5AC16_9HYPO|nr:hypothetical protein FBEOM_10105 [Fusarium beomiforme]
MDGIEQGLQPPYDLLGSIKIQGEILRIYNESGKWLWEFLYGAITIAQRTPQIPINLVMEHVTETPGTTQQNSREESPTNDEISEELMAAETELTRTRRDITDNTVIRDHILRIIKRRALENVNGWSEALDRSDKSLKVFEDDKAKAKAVIDRKENEIQCTEEAETEAARAEGLSHTKMACDVLKARLEMGPSGLASLGKEKLAELNKLVASKDGGNGLDTDMNEG